MNRIPEEYKDAKEFIRTSEYMFENFRKTYGEEFLDASPSVTGYTKAIESMLNLAVLKKYLEYIEDFSDEDSFKDLYFKSRNHHLRTAILRSSSKIEFTLTLGTWVWISKNEKDSLNKHFISFLTEKFDFNFIEKLSSILEKKISSTTSQTIVGLRNELSHTQGIKFQDVLEIKKKLIQTLNAIIELIFPLV